MILRWFRLLLIRLGYNPVGDTDYGCAFPRWCEWCGGDVRVTRPASAQCMNCGR